ncbi:MAG: hypothetical protein D6732_06665 [Methanobacteriota archaeon]|nr:MAG: hypothetical protein D6732_06665 [Euryarchaeota archaeon]
MTYEDIVRILTDNAKVEFRNQKPFRIGPLLENVQKDVRKLQIRMLATIFTPPNTFFAPSGRVIAKKEFLLRDNGGVHIIDLQHPSQKMIDLIDNVEFLQPVLQNIYKLFRKYAEINNDAIVKTLLQKIVKKENQNQIVYEFILWLKRMKP